MSDVRVEFERGKVANVTTQRFASVYDGTEIVVSGKFVAVAGGDEESRIVKSKVRFRALRAPVYDGIKVSVKAATSIL